MKVAAVQFCPKFKDFTGNTNKIIQLVTRASTMGAELIVLPELATTGYSFMSKDEAEPFAETLHEKQGSVGVMLALSKRLKVGIAWGLVEKHPGTKDLYNSQVLVLPDGTTTSYAKVNHWANDFLWAKAGRANPPIIDFRGVKVGLLICRDVRDKVNDKWESFYEKGDADVVCFSSNWGKGGFPATAWMEFVENNRMALVVSNRYGEEANNDFGGGGVCVIHKDKRVECDGLTWGQDCIVLGEI